LIPPPSEVKRFENVLLTLNVERARSANHGRSSTALEYRCTTDDYAQSLRAVASLTSAAPPSHGIGLNALLSPNHIMVLALLLRLTHQWTHGGSIKLLKCYIRVGQTGNGWGE